MMTAAIAENWGHTSATICSVLELKIIKFILNTKTTFFDNAILNPKLFPTLVTGYLF